MSSAENSAPGTARLKPVCTASGDKYTSYAGTGRKDAEHRLNCPACGKLVKMRKVGLDRFPSTIPHHHQERT